MRGQRSQTFSAGFQPCPVRVEMILWIVDGEIPKFLQLVLKNALKLLDYLPMQFSQSCEFCPIHAPLIPNHDTITWNVLNRRFLSIPELSQCFVETCCRHQNQSESIFTKSNKFDQFEHEISCLSKRICKSLHWVFIYISHMVRVNISHFFFQNWDLYVKLANHSTSVWFLV